MSFASNCFPTFSTASTTVTGITETVVATTNDVATKSIGQLIMLEFQFQLTSGSTQTGAVMKVYRGTTASGTPIYTSGTLTVAGGEVHVWDFKVTDQFTSDVANQQWCVSVTQSGGVGNGTATNAFTNVTLV